MAQITFINVSGPAADIYPVHAHGADCSDIMKTAKKNPLNEIADTVEANSMDEAFNIYNDEFLAEGGDGWQIRFFPCCGFKKATKKSQTEEETMTRRDILDTLIDLGYTGPTSYTKPRLLEILSEVAGGK